MNLLRLKYFFTKLLLNIKKKKIQFEYIGICPDIEMILQKLQHYHFIQGYRIDFKQNKILIFLSYDKEANPILTDIKIISNLGQRKVISLDKIKLFLKNYPYVLALARTSKGIFSFQECCTLECGGEFLAILI